MTPRVRAALLLAAALATGAAVMAVSDEPDDGYEVVMPVAPEERLRHAPSASARRSPVVEEQVLALLPRRFEGKTKALFRAAPPATPSVEAAPQAQDEVEPATPDLPFKFLGRMADGAGTAVLLSYKSKDVIARAGETIEQTYRIESIAEESIEFTYLPHEQRQTLRIGESN